MSDSPILRRRARYTSEAIILALACLAPWAFGSVEAWAALVLDAGVFLVAVLGLVTGWGPNRPRAVPIVLPGLALLALLALVQSLPIPSRLLAVLDPGGASIRSLAIPAAPERVLGDKAAPVALPHATLSMEPDRSIHAAVRLAAAGILFQAVIGLGAGHTGLRRFAVLMSANAAAMALFSLIQSLLWDGKIYGFRTSPVSTGWRTGGPFVGHNALAAYLNLGLGLGLGLLLSARRSHLRGSGAWAIYATGMTIVGLVASHSRSGLIAAMAGSLVMMAALRRSGEIRAGLAISAILAMAAGFLTVAGGSSPYQRLASLLEASAYEDRLEIWDAALRTWAAHPLLGSGLGTFGVASASALRHDRGVAFVRAENEYLDLLAEGGLVGLGLALVGLVGLFRGASRAFRSAPAASDRAVIAGGLFGLTALAVQSLGDFSPHIPGVAFSAVVLCGHLRALGSPQASPGVAVAAAAARPRMRVPAGRIVASFTALVVLVHASYRARSEARLAGSGIPIPGTAIPESIPRSVPRVTLEEMRAALEGALADRPDWAEGHLRLGMVHMALYQQDAVEWIGGEVEDPELAARMADPLWLHATVHSAPDAGLGADRDPTSHEPVRAHLVPAARCFLEARRCSPGSAAPHAQLASLDYLLDGGGPTEAHAGRALRLAGADGRLLWRIAQVAADGGAPDLASQAFRRCLEVREDDWEEIVDSAALALSEDRVFGQVMPPGALWPIRFAERLYGGPGDAEDRARYLREALRRLPEDRDLPVAERLRVEALALAGLGDEARARTRWEGALSLEPGRTLWRREMVAWLIGLGDIDEAHRQAVIGASLDPGNALLRQAVVTTAGMLARGRPAQP